MSSIACSTVVAPESSFKTSVLKGLRANPKRLDCKYFYDARGSRLFDRICQLETYYPTRTETEIMRSHASEMAQAIGSKAMLVEYGSGSSMKTRLLLDRLRQPVAYVPVDISRSHLHATANQLRCDYPNIEIEPVAADFTRPFSLPPISDPPVRKVAYFPGSTIGNFVPDQAAGLLKSMARLCSPGGGLLIGIDLVKDTHTLEMAYDEPAGITAQFNLNLLHRMRRELRADIDVENFAHVARYNAELARMEIYIRSLCEQEVVVEEESLALSAGELIHTEYSHKYTIEGFAERASRAGFTLRQHWTDPQQYFAVLYFSVESCPIGDHASR